MLKLPVFNLMKYSSTRNMAIQRSSLQKTNEKAEQKPMRGPESFPFDFLDVFRNSFQQEGKSWWGIYPFMGARKFIKESICYIFGLAVLFGKKWPYFLETYISYTISFLIFGFENIFKMREWSPDTTVAKSWHDFQYFWQKW